jgi:hypothetical protein
MWVGDNGRDPFCGSPPHFADPLRAVADDWHNANFESKEGAINYHSRRHAGGRSVREYPRMPRISGESVGMRPTSTKKKSN